MYFHSILETSLMAQFFKPKHLYLFPFSSFCFDGLSIRNKEGFTLANGFR